MVFSLVFRSWLIVTALGLSGYGWGDEIFPREKWDRGISPDAVGWSEKQLTFVDDCARTLQTDAYLIVHHGVIVHEYGATARATNVHSVWKSVLDVLMGIYADRGIVDLDKTLGDLGIDHKDGLSPTEKQATVRQLMPARSGIYHLTAYETSGMADSRPASGSFKPGTHWDYNNWDFNALRTIFRRFTGKTVLEALRDDLTRPLQLEDFRYSSDTRLHYEGVSEHPAYIIRLSARDLGRVGLLMARDGRWRDRQIVSEKWVAESTTSYSNTGPGIG